MSTKLSQSQEILRYMERNDHITAYMAMGVFKIMRLASRIDELRNDLFVDGDFKRIHSEMVRDARGTRYVRYRLVKPSNPLFHDVGCCHVSVDDQEAA